MFLLALLVAVFGSLSAQENQTCPNGDEIYSRGITDEERLLVVDMHNQFRLNIANGVVEGQPRGINLRRMKYNNDLEKGAQLLSDQCIFRHHIIPTGKFLDVGQNIYKLMSNKFTDEKHLARAMTIWFDENVHYDYNTTKSVNEHLVTHYTQMVWHDAEHVGCDFVHFHNESEPIRPYTKVFTCNYAPGGNWNNEPPYTTGVSGCENLC